MHVHASISTVTCARMHALHTHTHTHAHTHTHTHTHTQFSQLVEIVQCSREDIEATEGDSIENTDQFK